MAEAVSIVYPILESLTSALNEEHRRLEGVREQVEHLKLRFQFMKRFLRDAEKKRKPSVEVEEQVIHVIQLAYDVEDIINGYMLYLEQQRGMRFPFKIINIYRQFVTLHRFSKNIEAINARADAISQFASEYKTTDVETPESSDPGATHSAWRREGIPRAPDINVVGFEDQSAQLINLLKQESLHRRVISIIAMGGSGKTTLAQYIYNDLMVTSYFDCRMWITVSADYKERDGLVSALKPFFPKERTEVWSTAELKENLWNKLSIDKKYLLVVDDIWDVAAWDELIQNFPDNNNSSRVMLTTRNKQVALHADPSCINHHELRTLNQKESWELFCKKVFWMPDDLCPPELESLGQEIVQKCVGLPLSILAAGGLLMGRERRYDEWSKVYVDLNLHLSQDSSNCRPILMLSYNDLPCDNLKLCFLYLGMFPEDFEILALKVIRLWVAEGFVKDKGHQNMEDVAEDYLEELCQRSLIQVKRRMYHGGPFETFQMHDLFREIAISEGKKYQMSSYNYKYSSHINKSRRLSVESCVDHGETKQLLTATLKGQRSVLFFKSTFTLEDSWMSRFVVGNKFLRVLDLERVQLNVGLPKEIGNLTFLHYLGLRWTRVKSLPYSIGNLIKLQTLDVVGTEIEAFPKTIWKLKNLRHFLFLNTSIKNILFRNDLWNNLITLEGVSGMSWMNEDDIGLANAFTQRNSLLSLSIEGKLAVSNHQNRMINCFPKSLTKLFLEVTEIKEDPSAVLGSLQFLKVLDLNGAYAGKKMCFSSGTFLKLQHLWMGFMEVLSEWIVEDGAVPILVQVSLIGLPNLERLPRELRNVSSLRDISMDFMPKAKERHIKDGEPWDIVKVDCKPGGFTFNYF